MVYISCDQRGAYDVMIIVIGNGHGNPSSVYISYSTNTLGKGMNPNIGS